MGNNNKTITLPLEDYEKLLEQSKFSNGFVIYENGLFEYGIAFYSDDMKEACDKLRSIIVEQKNEIQKLKNKSIWQKLGLK